ncbi:unnamed protein product [Effrenium voratum]|uniref:Uncharacterized protein n=1 Tax=Effrenium voratum TaxID=2562239 RepID=A0AA36NL42_9DINO|nr:unnamed protein product [Effrenium voratum]CAJ1440096.1 unnamed protein product [Effrenium voratum]
MFSGALSQTPCELPAASLWRHCIFSLMLGVQIMPLPKQLMLSRLRLKVRLMGPLRHPRSSVLRCQNLRTHVRFRLLPLPGPAAPDMKEKLQKLQDCACAL